MVKFRFQDLKIWQFAIQIAGELFDIADALEEKRLYRFAEQLRAAGMSISNNIQYRGRIRILFQEGVQPILKYGAEIYL
jgi:hypothetical protein